MHKFFLLLILCLSIAVAKSQTPSLNFQLLETSGNNYDISTIIPLPDNTYGAFGNNSFGEYMVFIKMDSLGNVIVNKKYTFSSGIGTRFGSAIVNKNGEIALVGNDLSTFNSNIMFLRLNLNGDIISSKFYSAYSTDSNETGYSIIQTPDLGYILGGGTGTNDMFLTRIDSAGTRLWSKRYGFTSGTRAESMEIIGNNIYIVGNIGGSIAYHKVDLNGNFIWTKSTSVSFATFSKKIIKTTDNKLLVGGTNNFMAKIDTNGAFIWHRYYNSSNFQHGLGTITATPDGGFISCGTIQGSILNILSEGCITKFNALGEMQWVRRMGTIKNDELKMIVNAHGNRGFFVLGRCTDLNPASASNIYLARLGNDGYLPNITCEYSSEVEISSSSNYTYTTYTTTRTASSLGITTIPNGTLSVSNDVKMTKLSSCNNDIELTEIVSPNAIYCTTSSLPIQVRITNKGQTPVHRLTDNLFAGYVSYGSNIFLPNFTNLNILPQHDTVLTITTISNLRLGDIDITVVLPYTVNEFSDVNTNDNWLRKTIHYNPLTATIVTNQTTLCPNDSTNLTINPAVNAMSYQWFRNNDTLRGATNNMLTVKDNANYFVTIRNVDNCPYNSNSIQLQSVARPTTPIITQNGNTLIATNTTATSFQWYFNGNLIPNANQLTYTATQNGNYTVISIGLSCNSLTSDVYTAVVIPVEMKFVMAYAKGEVNKIEWMTASENSVKGFVVERSFDNKQWISIGTTAPKGGAKDAFYSVTDNQPSLLAYYRVRTVDLDGKEEVSKVVSVKRYDGNKLALLSVVPVPTTEGVTVDFSVNKNADVRLTLTNVMGQIVKTITIKASEGTNQMVLGMNELPNGTYLLTVSDGDNKALKRVVKQ